MYCKTVYATLDWLLQARSEHSRMPLTFLDRTHFPALMFKSAIRWSLLSQARARGFTCVLRARWDSAFPVPRQNGTPMDAGKQAVAPMPARQAGADASAVRSCPWPPPPLHAPPYPNYGSYATAGRLSNFCGWCDLNEERRHRFRRHAQVAAWSHWL